MEERGLGGLPLSSRCWFLRVVSLSTSLDTVVGLPLQEVLLLTGICVDGLGRPLLVLLGSGFGEGSLVLCRGIPEPGWARGRLFTFTPPLMVAQSQKLKKGKQTLWESLIVSELLAHSHSLASSP